MQHLFRGEVHKPRPIQYPCPHPATRQPPRRAAPRSARRLSVPRRELPGRLPDRPLPPLAAHRCREGYRDAYLTAHFEVPGEMFSLAMDAKRARGMGVVGSTQNILDFIAAK